MKLSSAILALSLLAVSASASDEQEHGTALLRGGVVDEVLHVVRDLGKNKKGGRTVGDEKKVAEDVEGEKVKADKQQKAQKQKDQKQKNKAGNKAGGGGGDNRGPGDCNVQNENWEVLCGQRSGGTEFNNRMGQCDNTGVIPAMVLDKKASQVGGAIPIEAGTECDEEDGDKKCVGCCCGGGYFGGYPNDHPNPKKRGQWRRACIVTDNFAAPVGPCISPDGVPIDIGNGGNGLGN